MSQNRTEGNKKEAVCINLEGDSTIHTLNNDMLEAFKFKIVTLLDRSKGKGYVLKHCKGCQVSSEVFPSHSKIQTSPKLNGQKVVKKENKKFLDIINFSINSPIGSSSINAYEEAKNDGCRRHPSQSSQSSSTDVLTI